MTLLRLFSISFAATAVACGGDSTSPAITTGPTTVQATDSKTFTPATVTVNAGDAVAFTFGTVPHNVYFDVAPGAPGDIAGNNSGVSVSRVFSTRGTYRYACHIHPSMTGTVVVQ